MLLRRTVGLARMGPPFYVPALLSPSPPPLSSSPSLPPSSSSCSSSSPAPLLSASTPAAASARRFLHQHQHQHQYQHSHKRACRLPSPAKRRPVKRARARTQCQSFSSSASPSSPSSPSSLSPPSPTIHEMHEMHDQGEQQGEHEHDVEEEINVLVTSVDAFDALATAVANKCKAMTAAGEYNDNDNDNGDFAGGSNVHAGQVYTLHGSLGVGKSTFARAFIRAFTGMPDLMVTSPTFTIDITYEHNNSSLHHMDLYRIHSEDELDILELGHVFTHDISLIEWPDRLGSCYPEDVIEIFIDDDIPEIVENDEARMVSIVPRGKWRDTYTTVNTGSSSPTEGRDTPTDAMDEVLLLIDNHPDIEYVD